MRVKLTDVTVASLKKGEYWDAAFPAFGVRVGKRTRTFILNHNKARKKLGHYPALSLAEARRKALSYAPDAPATILTVAEAITIYLRTADIRPSTLSSYTHFLCSRLEPKLGKRLITDIRSADVLAITDIMRDAPAARYKAHTIFKIFFNWCFKRDYIAVSPMLKLDKPNNTQSRSRVLTDDELKKIWLASLDMRTFGVVIRLCILTGQRRGEIAHIKKDWLLAPTTLVIPASIAKNGKEHSLPLTEQSAALAHELAQTLARPYNAWSKPKAKLDELSGVTKWTIHDLRRTCATKLATLGTPPVVIERILNHATSQSLGGAIGAIYNRHGYLAEMRQSLDAYDTWLLELMRLG